MSYTIKYKVNSLWVSPETINNFDQVVCNVFFTITATDIASNISGSDNFVANLKQPDSSTQQFTPYNQLSEAQIIDWAKDSFIGDAVELMEAQVVAIMNKSILTQALPWA